MKIKEQLELQKDIEVPWHVWTKFGNCAKKVSLHGNQVSLTNEADFANLEELRRAIEWYADQLGGKIKWDN
jgi:hypothetical protein